MPTANRSSSEPAGPDRLDALIRRLTALDTGGAWVVSLYLKLEPRDRQRGKYLIKLKNRVRDRLAEFEATEPAREALQQVRRELDRIQEVLENPTDLPAGRGVAVFACGPADLFEVVPMARVFRSRLTIDRTPLVRELQAVRDEFGRVLCVVTDRASARLFEVTAAGAEELPAIVAPDTAESGKYHGGRQRQGTGAGGRAAGVSGVGEHNWHQRIREERHRHYAAIADRLFERSRGDTIQGIVLAGNKKDTSGLEPHLHPYVKDLVIGSARLNPQDVEASEVLDVVLRERRAREREWERRHAAELREAVATGWGATGVAAVLDALARGQVRTLLVGAETTCAGFRCVETGRLTVLPDDCRGEGAAEPVDDVIDEAVEEALRQGAHVDVVEDDEARVSFDGLGALLRFRRR